MKKIILTFITTLLFNNTLTAMEEEITNITEKLVLIKTIHESLTDEDKRLFNHMDTIVKQLNETMQKQKSIKFQIEQSNEKIKKLENEISILKEIREEKEVEIIFPIEKTLSEEITGTTLTFHTTIYKNLCENDASTLTIKILFNRNDQITSLKILDSALSKIDYLTAIKSLNQLEKDFMNIEVVEVTTPQNRTHNWTLYDINMAIIGGFIAEENRWERWANDLRSLILKGHNGNFLRPFSVAKISDRNCAKSIVNYFKPNTHTIRHSSLNFRGTENHNMESMARKNGILK